MTVRELLARLGADELAEWLAYWRLEPWGSVREDVRTLYQAQACVAPWQKGGGRLDTRRHFPHLFRGPQQSVEEMIAVARLLNAAHGGREE